MGNRLAWWVRPWMWWLAVVSMVGCSVSPLPLPSLPSPSAAIPRADAQRFSVAVADFGDDKGGQVKGAVVRGLRMLGDKLRPSGEAVGPSLQVLKVPHAVALSDTGKPEDDAQRGHTAARALLKQCGATVLVWGRVVATANGPEPELYLTSADAQPVEPLSMLPADGRGLEGPAWLALSDMLELAVASSYTEAAGRQGHYVADQLKPFLKRTEKLIGSEVFRNKWRLLSRARVRRRLGNGWTTYGEQRGDRAALRRAIKLHRESIAELYRERADHPLVWGYAQNSIGNAFTRLGELESNPEHLKQAVRAYEAALEELTRKRVSLSWAMTQNNLGIALMRLSEQ